MGLAGNRKAPRCLANGPWASGEVTVTTGETSPQRSRAPDDTHGVPATLEHRSPGSRLRRHAGVLGVISGGGAVGSVARYLVELALPTLPGSFPWGTFAVNVVGCLLLGLLMVLVTEVWRSGRYLRPFLGVGVLGGFTTFSALAVETHALAARGQWLLTNAYVVASVVAGLAAVWIGVVLARVVTRRPVRRLARR